MLGKPWTRCEQPEGHVLDATDCDDGDPLEHPEAVWYEDGDGDDFGDLTKPMVQCEIPKAYVADSTDCDPSNIRVYPGAPEVCDGVANDCGDTLGSDEQDDDGDTIVECAYDVAIWAGDGTVTGGGDCDDGEILVFPGASELCDGITNDCDTASLPIDEVDVDGDTYVACAYDVATWLGDDAVKGGGDCAPLNGTVLPGGKALCDGLINDCSAESLSSDERDKDGDGVVECTFDSNGWDGDTSVTADGDCDDADATVFPGAPSLCDGVINDCDETVLDVIEVDDDNDGYVECTPTGAIWGILTGGDDCDDVIASINPGATEVCDALDVDEDCNGLADDDDPLATGGTALYPDFDGDGYGDDEAIAATYCDAPSDHVVDHTDCDDLNANAYPGATELAYDFVDQDCDGADLCDVDGDGEDSVLCLGMDCDDGESLVFPGAPELCDGITNDCDTAGLPIDEVDVDGDTYVACAYDVATWLGDDAVKGGGDCAPLNGTVLPGGKALCDGLINDCSAESLSSDERDKDGDGVVECTFDSNGWDGDTSVTADGDCDDADATVFPGAPSLCDGVINDCDETVLDVIEVDDDNDGYVECTPTGAIWGILTGGDDCDDVIASINPGATEVCDALDVDEDCNGLADDDDPLATGGTALYPDFDGDGYGNNEAIAVTYCDAPSDHVADHTDCDDLDADANPGATELAYDFIDQDCDGADLCDVDGDGEDSVLCLGVDCDDDDASIHTDADEIWYDDIDQDCDGTSDHDQDGDGFDAASGGGDDCDDGNPSINPAALDEDGDDIDHDCDGEDAASAGCGCTTSPSSTSSVFALLALIGLGVRRRR